MQIFKRLVLLVVFFGLTECGAAQDIATAATLWQFGIPRVLPGWSTLPLLPMGTAADSSTTTFLYNAFNDVTITTTDASAGKTTTETMPSPTPRTIAWEEYFDAGGSIACTLVDSDFGYCVNNGTITSNSGAPTPIVIAIARTAASAPPPPSFSTIVETTLSMVSPSTNSALASATQHATSVIWPIVGGIVGGFVGFLLAVLVLWDRRRARVSTKTITPFDSSPSVEASLTAVPARTEAPPLPRKVRFDTTTMNSMPPAV